MIFVNEEEECPEGWEALPLPNGRLLCVDPENSEEYEKVAEAYHHALSGDMDEFWNIVNK